MQHLRLFVVFVNIAFCGIAQKTTQYHFTMTDNDINSSCTIGYISRLEDSSLFASVKTSVSKNQNLAPRKPINGFVMANASYSIAPQFSLGITMGMHCTWGWFLSIASDIDSKLPEYTKTIPDGSSYYYFTGNKKTSRFSILGGAMYKISYIYYAKLAAGYGIREVGYRTMENDFINIENQTFKGLEYSVGIHLDLGETAFSLDVNTIGFNFQYSEIKIGIGKNFKINTQKLRKEAK